jgi:hypothetical protein
MGAGGGGSPQAARKRERRVDRRARVSIRGM